MNHNELRKLFPITENYVYLNHAGVSPPPTTAIEAMTSQLRDVQMRGILGYRGWLAAKHRCRALMAQLLNAEAEQIAFMRNTSDGLSTIANGLTWEKGENIVTFAKEFPSNIYPWRRIRDKYGVELRLCPERDGRIETDEFISLIDEKTRVVTISAVQFASGFRADLKKISEAAHKVDALFVVDGIQALGVTPIDVQAQGIDALAGASHKWLLAPEGAGYLYLSERARNRIEPTLVGWISVENPDDFADIEQNYRGGTLAWESGTFASSLFYALEVSLNLLLENGVENSATHLGNLTDFLCESLDTTKYEIISSRLPNEKSAIVCIKNLHGISSDEIMKALEAKKICVSSRGDRLRIAPHIYNTEADISILVNALNEI